MEQVKRAVRATTSPVRVSDGNGGSRVSKTKVTSALGALAVIAGTAAGVPEKLLEPATTLLLFGMGFFLRGR